MKINKSRLTKIVNEELTKIREATDIRGRDMTDDDPQYASLAGAKQDIEMRTKRGDPYEGDWGYYNTGGESYGELPWVVAAVEALEDAEYDVRAKAVAALADELGVSVRASLDRRVEEPLKEELAKFEEAGDYMEEDQGDDDMESMKDDHEDEHGEPYPNPLIKPSERLSGQEQADNFFRSMYAKGWKGPGAPWPKSE